MFNQELTNILEEFSESDNVKDQMEIDNEESKDLSQIQKEKVHYLYLIKLLIETPSST